MTTKLKDLTTQQFIMWKAKNCNKECSACLFQYLNCGENSTDPNIWTNCKGQFSEDLLNTTIEIDPILTNEEKEYLNAVIKPFKNRITSITKYRTVNGLFDNIRICYYSIKDSDDDRIIVLPDFNANTMYNNMKPHKSYTLEELGL